MQKRISSVVQLISETHIYIGLTNENFFMQAAPEFRECKRKSLIIHKGLYKLRSSGVQSHKHLAAKLALMGFKPSYFNLNL